MAERGAEVAAVVIGRNEGARLVACLASLAGQAKPIVYVDSGSTDGSVDAAHSAGAEVEALDMTRPFTAARARNAGYAKVRQLASGIEFVQFVDGDCEIADGWIAAARDTMRAEPDVAAVCGRLREKHPEATFWNGMMDAEWDAPVGDVAACGGIAMIRRAAFDEAGGFRSDLIAGEEPEMCYRLRQKGWRIRRIAAEMGLHDAAMTRFSQWWMRNRRTGYAYAEGAALHGRGPERYRVRELGRSLFWGGAVPAAAVSGAFLVSPWALAILLLWPAQILRFLLRGDGLARAVFLVLGKLPETQGALTYWISRMSGRRSGLIEYRRADR